MAVAKTLYQKIKQLIKGKPHYADQKRQLCCRIWYDEIKAMNLDPDKIEGTRLLMLYRDGKLTDGEAIGRARRKVEKENAALRGETWEARQEKQKKSRNKSGYGVFDI